MRFGEVGFGEMGVNWFAENKNCVVPHLCVMGPNNKRVLNTQIMKTKKMKNCQSESFKSMGQLSGD